MLGWAFREKAGSDKVTHYFICRSMWLNVPGPRTLLPTFQYYHATPTQLYSSKMLDILVKIIIYYSTKMKYTQGSNFTFINATQVIKLFVYSIHISEFFYKHFLGQTGEHTRLGLWTQRACFMGNVYCWGLTALMGHAKYTPARVHSFQWIVSWKMLHIF